VKRAHIQIFSHWLSTISGWLSPGTITLFGCSYQHGLSAVIQYFSLTTKQPQPAYKPQKQHAEQGECFSLATNQQISDQYFSVWLFNEANMAGALHRMPLFAVYTSLLHSCSS
jgi:hypothetical protein